jgi:hypothetical protein
MPRRKSVVEAEPETVAPSIRWVKLNRYCEMTGDSRAAVHARRASGKWLDGIHCRVVDHVLWVDLVNVNEWIEGGIMATQRAIARRN